MCLPSSVWPGTGIVSSGGLWVITKHPVGLIWPLALEFDNPSLANRTPSICLLMVFIGWAIQLGEIFLRFTIVSSNRKRPLKIKTSPFNWDQKQTGNQGVAKQGYTVHLPRCTHICLHGCNLTILGHVSGGLQR